MRSCVTFCLLVSLATTGYSQEASKRKAKPNSAYRKVVDDPALPSVLLIGDSISIGYTVPVQDLLKGKANVHRVPTNAGNTGKGLQELPKWLAQENGKWDVIHFNWGLHDLCYRYPAEKKNSGQRNKIKGKVTFSPEEYADNLDKLVEQLEQTGAKLIFATTTPVPEGEPGRVVGDGIIYNNAAVAVMKKHNIPVNDLHAVMADKMGEFATQPGNVHFKPEGSKKLAEQVASRIEEALAVQRAHSE